MSFIAHHLFSSPPPFPPSGCIPPNPNAAPGSVKAKIIVGDPLSPSCAFAAQEKVMTVKKLLSPVDVPRYGGSLRCLGTNYPIGGAKKPPYPILF